MPFCGACKASHNTVADVRECFSIRYADEAAHEDAAAAERRAELIHESPALVNMAYADELEHERNMEAWDQGLQRLREGRPMTRREEDELEYRIERAQEAAEWRAEDRMDAQGY